MVCLANSRKLSGRCIAGKEMQGGQPSGWVRPVSAREHEEVSEYERQYQDGSDPAILDVIDLQLIEPRPKGYQQENWLLDPQTYWGKVNRITWNDLPALQDPAAALWIDGHSTYNGLNDQIPLALAGALTTSLRLIHIDDLAIRVFRPGEAFGNNKRRVQGRFEHHGFEYRLWVTDPRYERTFLLEADGEYEVGECYLTISLGEALNNVCYKLIAAIIEP
jgi:hypothetical protein